MMVHQLLLTNHLILTHLQDIRKHMLRSQNIARYQQRTQSLVPWPQSLEGVLVLNISPRPLCFQWKEKIDF